MKIVLSGAPLLRTLRWAQRLLFTGAAAALAYCGFVLTDAWLFQVRANEVLAHVNQVPSLGVAAIGPEGLIGRIEIDRLDLSVAVVEGIGKKALRRAAGHIPNTALPGQLGNIGISAHRDTFFRPLKDVRSDDVITLVTPAGEYRYRVVSMNVVNPTDIAVLAPSPNEVLTLVTCYPFYFAGFAPQRFIVRAERVL